MIVSPVLAAALAALVLAVAAAGLLRRMLIQEQRIGRLLGMLKTATQALHALGYHADPFPTCTVGLCTATREELIRPS